MRRNSFKCSIVIIVVFFSFSRPSKRLGSFLLPPLEVWKVCVVVLACRHLHGFTSGNHRIIIITGDSDAGFFLFFFLFAVLGAPGAVVFGIWASLTCDAAKSLTPCLLSYYYHHQHRRCWTDTPAEGGWWDAFKGKTTLYIFFNSTCCIFSSLM